MYLRIAEDYRADRIKKLSSLRNDGSFAATGTRKY
jgi:hypothetical protein